MFVAIAKFCRQEQLSCLFQDTEESNQIHQALETKRSTSCQIRLLNEKSHVLFQDSYFMVGKAFDKGRVKKSISQNKVRANTF